VLPVARTKAINDLNPTLLSAAATHKKKTEKNLSADKENIYINKISTKTSIIIKRLNAFLLLKGKIINTNMSDINATETI